MYYHYIPITGVWIKMVLEYCYNHPNIEATASCGSCQKFICKACTVVNLCPQCAGRFPLPKVTCTIHPDEPAEFMCNSCGKPFCTLEKHEHKELTGTSKSAFRNMRTEIFGCSTGYPARCSYAMDYENRKKTYRREYQEYLKKNKNAKCSKCGKKMELVRLAKGIKYSARFTCKNCNDFIKLISAVEEWNGLDNPEIIKNAIKPSGSTRLPKGQSEGIYCSHCGSAIPPGSKFCNKCGEKVTV